MVPVITEAERASYRRCRRQWDFGAGIRQDLEPRHRPAVPDLDRAVRDALAIYYFPGMWDWDRNVRLPLVMQELERAMARQRQQCGASADAPGWQEQLQEGRALLARYFEWAPAADRFAPVLVEPEFDVDVMDPAQPGAGLVTSGGGAIRYRGRIGLMAVDQHDAYWVVRHRVVDGDWAPTEELAADEETLTACWAWEQFYIGMTVTGTIYNELRRPSDTPGGPARSGPRRIVRPWRRLRLQAAGALPLVRQHEPSGGGRSIPQHRRMYARATEDQQADPVEQQTEDGFRRTWMRRSPADIAAAGRRLGADVAEMIRPGLPVPPEPSGIYCPPCPYLDPCRALQAGEDAGPILRSGYQKRPPGRLEEGRLGGGAWSIGRGAAPPNFRRRNG